MPSGFRGVILTISPLMDEIFTVLQARREEGLNPWSKSARPFRLRIPRKMLKANAG